MQENYDIGQEFEDTDEAFEERRRIRARRMAERKRIRKRKQKIYRMAATGVILLAAIVVFGTIIVNGIHRLHAGENPKESEKTTVSADGMGRETEGEEAIGVYSANPAAEETEQTTEDAAGENGAIMYSFTQAPSLEKIPEEVVSTSVIFIDRQTCEIIAGIEPKKRINPASMTKILTVLVAAEHVQDLDDTFTITREITDYGYVNDCSAAGFLEDETVTVRDLFYGTILPSGADAGVGLATYVAGSQEKFVEMMNEKLEQLGISDTTHVTNCVGIYDENHYSTPYDMAVILQAALENELCREVMAAHSYTTSVTEQHPEGIIISNWFLRRIEDKDTGGEVICAKTGYVVQSGSCAASYGKSANGKEYICVTAGSTSSWRCIYDHVALYKQFSQR